MNEKRDIESEKKKLNLYILGGFHAPLFPITIGYYLVAKFLFGLNLYVSAILAGLTGGLWSFAISKGYDLRRQTEEKDPWYSLETYQKRLRYLGNIAVISFFVLIGEIFIIWFFKL